MKYNKAFRLLGIVIVLSLLVVLPATPVQAAPIIAISPTSGSLGTKVTLTAENFLSYAGDSVFIFFNDTKVGSRTVPSTGSFTTEFHVPDNARPGTARVTVKDKDGNQLGDKVSFTINKIEIELDPSNGTVGTIVTIDGKGFYADKSVTFHYNEEMRPMIGTGVATPTGECSYSFTIPDSTAGNHEIVALDALDNSATANFKVIPSGTLDPTSGAIGDTATVRGTGFGFKSFVTVYFNNAVVAFAKTNKYGNFEVSFYVPVLEPGTYTVEAEDEDDNTYKARFTIAATAKARFTIAATATLSPTTGYVGSELTVNGNGFIVGRTVTIKFDGTSVATDTVKPDGTFSVTLKVPTSRHGEHNITASDGTNTKNFTFTMESTAPMVPVPLKPEMGIKAEPQAYFDWEGVTDPSGVTYTLQIASNGNFTSIVLEKKGLTESEYTITEEEKLKPVSKKSPYYYWHVKAVDGATNESGWSGAGSFYVGFSLAMPQWAIYTLLGIGAILLVLLGFWLGRRIAYYSSY